MRRTVKRLEGSTVLSTNGEELGEVKDFYFDDRNWVIRYLVIDTGSWLSQKLVLISPHAITSFGLNGFNILTNLTKDQIEKCPPADTEKPISKEFEDKYANYFGWPVYVTGTGIPVWYSSTDKMNMPSPDIETDTSAEADIPSDNHLRSFNEIRNYHISSFDDEFGHIEDMVLEDGGFKIDALIVDTVNFWPSNSVLISPKLIKNISWASQVFETSLSKAEVESAPIYRPEDFIDAPSEWRDKTV
jgi:hypothetical protein